MNTRTEAVKAYLLDLQDRICTALEQEDGSAHFVEDAGLVILGGAGKFVVEAERIEKPAQHRIVVFTEARISAAGRT